jgi:hypothetical protein
MIGLALMLAATAGAPQPRPIEIYKDWTVGCDNGRACQAVALQPAETFDAATMAVKRGAEAGAVPEIWITARDQQPVAVVVDGKRFALNAIQSEYETTYRPEEAARFLAAIVSAKRAALVDKAGKQVAPLSVAGASAALLYIDDKQGRIGTVTALVRKGTKPASAVPPAPALPVIAGAPGSAKPPRMLSKAAVIEARKDSACETPEEEGEPEAFRLDARHSLVFVPLRCGSGAYNFLSGLFLVDDSGRAVPARFDSDDGNEGEDHWIYNSGWDPKTRRLGTYFKGRGIGDCGTTQTFAWDGSRFRLVEQTEMGECRGSTDYITTWRAQVKPR